MKPRIAESLRALSPWLPPAATRWIMGAIVALNVLLLLAPSAGQWVIITPGTLPGLRLSAVWLNWLVAEPGSALILVLVVGLLVWLNQQAVRAWWRRSPGQTLGVLVGGPLVIIGLNHLLDGLVIGLAVSALTVAWGAGAAERRWGARKLLTFTAILLTVVGVLDASLAWLWPGAAEALISDRAANSWGTTALFHGFMAVYAAILGRQRLALLNVEGRHLVWFFVALDVIDVLFLSMRRGLAGLVAIAVARALIHGTWRPQVLRDRFALWRVQRRRAQMRAVPPGAGRNRPLN